MGNVSIKNSVFPPAPAPKKKYKYQGHPRIAKAMLHVGRRWCWRGRGGEVGWVTMGRVGKNRSERRRTLPASATISLKRNREKVAGT